MRSRLGERRRVREREKHASDDETREECDAPAALSVSARERASENAADARDASVQEEHRRRARADERAAESRRDGCEGHAPILLARLLAARRQDGVLTEDDFGQVDRDRAAVARRRDHRMLFHVRAERLVNRHR